MKTLDDQRRVAQDVAKGKLGKRAEEALHDMEAKYRRQIAFDELITRLLARFASDTGPEIDQHISAALEEIGRFVGVEDAAVLQVSSDGSTWSNTHEWCAPGFPYLRDKHQKMALGTFPWIERRLLAGETIQVRSKAELPPEATTARRLWEEEGFKSLLQVPLHGRGGTIQGCISLCAMRQEVAWTAEDMQRLRILSEVTANVLERQQAEEARHQARDELARANAELEQRVAQRTAQLVEANANLQTFTYTAAHDLRAPIRAIRSFSKIAIEDYGKELGSEGRSLLERVVGNADQMQHLLTDLLDYCKMSQAEVKLAPVDLHKAVSEALGLLQEEVHGKNAVVTVAESLPVVSGHPATLVMLINNFISNALKFVAPGVQPRIRIWGELRTQESKTGAPTIRLWVEDNGIGVAPEHQRKVFGAFERLHGVQAYPGTGLGLAIVIRGAERMGGRVGVESELGKGSRFWVELPGE